MSIAFLISSICCGVGEFLAVDIPHIKDVDDLVDDPVLERYLAIERLRSMDLRRVVVFPVWLALA